MAKKAAKESGRRPQWNEPHIRFPLYKAIDVTDVAEHH